MSPKIKMFLLLAAIVLVPVLVGFGPCNQVSVITNNIRTNDGQNTTPTPDRYVTPNKSPMIYVYRLVNGKKEIAGYMYPGEYTGFTEESIDYGIPDAIVIAYVVDFTRGEEHIVGFVYPADVQVVNSVPAGGKLLQ